MMKHLKNLAFLIISFTIFTSCEKEQNILIENAEINNQKLKTSNRNYPPTDFTEGYILNLSAKNNEASRIETENYPCQIINGGFETGDFTGWNLLTTNEPFVPWLVVSDYEQFFPPTTESIEPPQDDNGPSFWWPYEVQDGDYMALNGFDGNGPMVFAMWQDITICCNSELSWTDRIAWDFAPGWGSPDWGEEPESIAMDFNPEEGPEPRTFSVQLRDPSNNNIITTLYTFSTDDNEESFYGDTGYQTHTVSLSNYTGLTVRLYFEEIIPQNFTGPGQIEFDAISISISDTDDDGIYDCDDNCPDTYNPNQENYDNDELGDVCDDDDDNDGKLDVNDKHPYSNMSETIIIDGCDSGVLNVMVEGGTFMADEVDDLINSINSLDFSDARKTFAFKMNMYFIVSNWWFKYNLISNREKLTILNCVWQATYPFENDIE